MLASDGRLLAIGQTVQAVAGIHYGKVATVSDIWETGALAGLFRINGTLVVEPKDWIVVADPEPVPPPEPEPVKYGAYEMHACLPLRVLDPAYSGDDAVEQVDDPDELAEHAEHVLWAVYGHLTSGGIEWIADRATQAEARELGERLAASSGVPLYDDTPGDEVPDRQVVVRLTREEARVLDAFLDGFEMPRCTRQAAGPHDRADCDAYDDDEVAAFERAHEAIVRAIRPL